MAPTLGGRNTESLKFPIFRPPRLSNHRSKASGRHAAARCLKGGPKKEARLRLLNIACSAGNGGLVAKLFFYKYFLLNFGFMSLRVYMSLSALLAFLAIPFCLFSVFSCLAVLFYSLFRCFCFSFYFVMFFLFVAFCLSFVVLVFSVAFFLLLFCFLFLVFSSLFLPISHLISCFQFYLS